ncbi:MAG: DUF4184 family protein [Candidatus Bathyarchaeia archaeon]|jgi:membrane-bound metal-dependent hydrolase YbcI (DUF457 family)
MPFTPFHLGPALAVGLPLRRYLHVPTFIVGNVILDVEGFLVITLGLSYPLHGYLHTFVSAIAVGLLLGLVMFKLERPLQPFYRKIELETEKTLKLTSFLLAGVFGAVLHVLFDAFLYSEMMPFYPMAANPFLSANLSMSTVYMVCAVLGVFGLAYYAVILTSSIYKRMTKNR